MNNWMKMGMAGMALAGSLQALAQDTPPEDPKAQTATVEGQDADFRIEASDLVAGKLRDYVKEEKIDKVF